MACTRTGAASTRTPALPPKPQRRGFFRVTSNRAGAGYNTWDDFRCGGINASNLHKVADALVALGLDKLGYRYISLDDARSGPARSLAIAN